MHPVDHATVVAEGVSKVFFSGSEPVWALEDFSLTVEPGVSSPASSAPRGAGSPRSCGSSAGLRSAPVGEVTMRGADHPVPAAFVFQEHGVFPWMTVQDNVAFGLRMTGTGRP